MIHTLHRYMFVCIGPFISVYSVYLSVYIIL